MSTQIDSLSIRIESNSQSAAAAIDTLVAALGRLKTASNLGSVDKGIKKIADAANRGMSGTSSAFNKGAKAVKDFAHETDKASESAKGFGSAIRNATGGVLQFVGNALGIHTVGEALANALASAREWDGISARFAEGFADQVDEAYAHVQKLSEALYINDQAFMQYSSNFATLARGFGVTESSIKDMSIGLTELAYDIYAKNNDFYTFEESMDAVRSAIVGEVEPIRRAGISITEATLKEVAAANGITKSVENMTEAEKALLRYKAMVDQAYASGTVGTYIKELGTVEGSSRALAQQLKGLAQAIGSLVMPAIAAVMPYFQALIQLATRAISALASLFGFRIKAPTWGGGLSSAQKSAEGATNALQSTTKAAENLGSSSSAVGKTTKALNEAGASAKKLKDYMMGFDELNVIRPPDESSGGGGGGGVGGGGGIELEIGSLWTDEMIAAANLRADEIADNIVKALQPVKDAIDKINFQPLIDSAKRLWEAIKPFAATIGEGLYWFLLNVLVPLAAYTIENIIPDFLNGLAAVLEWVTPQLKEFGAWVVENKEHIAKVAGMVVAFFLAFKGVTFLQTALAPLWNLTKSISKGLGPALSWLAPRVQSTAVLFTSGGGGLGGALKVVQALFSSLGGVIAKVITTVFSPLSLVVIAVAATAMVLVKNWDKVVATFKNFIKRIDLAGKFEAVKKALDPLMEKLAGLQDLFTIIGTVGATILAGFAGFAGGAFNALWSALAPLIDAVGGLIDLLAGLGTFLVGVFTLDMNKVVEGLQTMWQGIVTFVSGLVNAVIGFFVGFNEGVLGFFAGLLEALGLGEFVDSVTSFFSGLWGNIVAIWEGIPEWFSTLFSNVWTGITNALSAVRSWFAGLWGSIKGTWNGATSWFSNLFTNTWTAIKKVFSGTVIGNYFTTIWNTIQDVFSVVESILSGNFSDAWESIKGIFANWGSFFSGLWETISTTFTDLGTKLGDAVGGAVASGINSILSWVESTVNGAIDLINSAINIINKIPGVDIGNLEHVSIATMTVEAKASGGYVDQGQLFIAREAGAEMVGSMNGHTAVANNDQIVAGISQGVYSAVRAAMQEGGNDGNAAVNVYLDGKQITASVEKHQRERGATIMTGGVSFGY